MILQLKFVCANESQLWQGREIGRVRKICGTICSHAGRQAVFEIGSERLQTREEKGARRLKLVVEEGGQTPKICQEALEASHSMEEWSYKHESNMKLYNKE